MTSRSHRRIDVHAHFLPPAYVAAVGGKPEYQAAFLPWSLDLIADLQTRYEIDATVLSVSHKVFAGDHGLARELARAINEEGARIKRSDPDRFATLASLPLPDVDAALAELGFALDELALDGVLLHTNVAGKYLGDPVFAPLFDELDRRAAYVLIHPTEPPIPAPQRDRFPAWVVEYPFETTRTVLSLIYSGTLARCRRMRLQLSHAGGAVPFLFPRMASLREREPQFEGLAGGDIPGLLATLFYDTGLANDAQVVKATLAVARPSHIVFGTDWPYAALPDAGADPAPSLALLADDYRQRIDVRNAGALISRWGDPQAA